MAEKAPARRITWWSARLAARSRREAFTALHREHASAVFSISLRLLGNREDAEDVTQETLLKAFERLARDGEPQGRAWLYRVAVNACYDRLRARRRRPMVAWQPEFELALSPTLDQREQAELQRQIEEAFRRVPPAQRAALLLREVHGLRTAELAETLGLTTGSVEVTLARARSCFRRQFVAVSQDDTGMAASAATRRAEGPADVDSTVLRSLPAWSVGALPPALGATALLAKGSVSAGAAGGGAAAGLMTKLGAAFSAKAAAVALGATAVAGVAAAGGLYSAEHAQDQPRHRTAPPPAAAAREVHHSSVAVGTSRPHPATAVVAAQTAHPTATTSPSPSTAPLVVGESGSTPSPSATPTPAATSTDTASPTPSASATPTTPGPSPSASATPTTPSPSPSASPTASPSPSASP